MLKKSNKNTGFSIMELVVSTAIIAIGLLGVSSLVIQNLQVKNINKNQLIASMLAQEGLELVRNVRDDNWLSQSLPSWDKDIADHTNDFAIDYRGRASINGNADTISDADAKLYIDGAGLYTHVGTGNTATAFSRIINIVGDGDKIEVGALVAWNDRGRNFNYTASTTLYDWR